jgi:uncharacterized membrane protein YdfJ with MMPL/SSD domain
VRGVEDRPRRRYPVADFRIRAISLTEWRIVEEMRRIAYETVLRACAFASLAIFCVMIGLSFLPRTAFQAGGFLSILMTLVLVLKAHEARTKDHRRTEMWLYLPKESRPPQALAQKLVSTLMREIYLQFASWTAMISIVMWTIALFFSAVETLA